MPVSLGIFQYLNCSGALKTSNHPLSRTGHTWQSLGESRRMTGLFCSCGGGKEEGLAFGSSLPAPFPSAPGSVLSVHGPSSKNNDIGKLKKKSFRKSFRKQSASAKASASFHAHSGNHVSENVAGRSPELFRTQVTLLYRLFLQLLGCAAGASVGGVRLIVFFFLLLQSKRARDT